MFLFLLAVPSGCLAVGRMRTNTLSLGHSLHSVSFEMCEMDKPEACVSEKARIDKYGISNAVETAGHGGEEYYTFIRAIGTLSKCRVQHADLIKRGGVYWCDSWGKKKSQPPITLHKGNLLVFIPGRDKDTGEAKTFTARLTLLDEPSLGKGKDLELNYAIDLRNCEVGSGEELHCQEPIPNHVRIKGLLCIMAALRSPYPAKEDNLSYQLCDLAAFDIDHIDAKKDDLEEIARDNTQLLINRIFDLRTESAGIAEGPVFATLPEATQLARQPDGLVVRLPREKPLPKPKPMTRWEKFAKEKGLDAKKKRSRMVWDETSKDWVPRWGPNSIKHNQEKMNWLVEVDEDRGDNPYEDPFAKQKAIEKLGQAKQKVREMRNKLEGVGKKLPAGISGGPELGSIKRGTINLKESLARAQKSSASSGKFDKRQKNEKEVPVAKRRKVNTATPINEEKSKNLAVIGRLMKGETTSTGTVKVDKKKAAGWGQTLHEAARKEEKAQSGGAKKKKAHR
ncbi:Rhodanese- sulfurtransferase [Perkinsus olseni]|uniref:Rhodanese- sulfurtransferase n=1 Tax=Perkinsus olseni TaxID=32597 RepID=A0A7J6LZG0_PEROL|nr:Rhodanese- sulfurtransferase [Perkinsus olseni]